MSAADNTGAEGETHDETPLSELIEFHLSAALLQANGDLLTLLQHANSLDEDGHVPGADKEDRGPFDGGWKLFRDISVEWQSLGAPRYVLSASMASLLVSTKAPAVNDETLTSPYDCFVLEVPGDWTSMPGLGPMFVMLARVNLPKESKGIVVIASRRFDRPARVDEDDTRRLGVDLPDVFVQLIADEEQLEEQTANAWTRRTRDTAIVPPYFTEAVRYLVNTCCLVTAHRECAVRRSGKNASKTSAIHDVRPPVDVSVTAEFRRYAQNLVANRRIAERKDALLHIVRGHWKRQVRGAGRVERSLIWVKPYQRGAESLGRIVEKVISIKDLP